ncbi:MAG: sugar transferase [Minisyncoccia bacterium]
MENIFSRIVAIILLIIAFPFLVICILIIRMESKGNPIFKQSRVGKKGEIFTIYKLRTMYLGKEPIHIVSSMELEKHEYHRITYIGKFFRKYHIDEIPQLWNIVKNEMSFVGPRPLIIPMVEKIYYAPRDEKVKPGLTGLAQISSLRKIKGYNTLKLDKFYCKKRNTKLDLFIVYMTLFYIFCKR